MEIKPPGVGPESFEGKAFGDKNQLRQQVANFLKNEEHEAADVIDYYSKLAGKRKIIPSR